MEWSEKILKTEEVDQEKELSVYTLETSKMQKYMLLITLTYCDKLPVLYFLHFPKNMNCENFTGYFMNLAHLFSFIFIHVYLHI